MSNFPYTIVQAMHNFTEILYLQHCHHCWFVTSRVIMRMFTARVKLALPIILMTLMQSGAVLMSQKMINWVAKMVGCSLSIEVIMICEISLSLQTRAQNIITNNRDKAFLINNSKKRYTSLSSPTQDRTTDLQFTRLPLSH
jgi:hypothetical protein